MATNTREAKRAAWVAMACLVSSAGCAAGLRPVAVVAVLSDEAVAAPTQMIRPGVVGQACAWSPPWGEPKDTWPMALHRALKRAPEATLLENASIDVSMLHVGAAVRRCVRVRGDATRRIREIVLPAVGGPHAGHQ